MNLLASNIQNGLLVFVLGMLIVFLGIALIVIVISILGKILHRNKQEPKTEEPEVVVNTAPVTPYIEEGVTPQVVAAITAVITAYYLSNGSNCEFRLKKIKRIH